MKGVRETLTLPGRRGCSLHLSHPFTLTDFAAPPVKVALGAPLSAGWESVCKPGSVFVRRSIYAAYPGARRATALLPYSALLQAGFARPRPLPSAPVGSYPTFSPLLASAVAKAGGLVSVALSVGSLRPGLPPAPCPAEPGLSSPAEAGAAVRPTPGRLNPIRIETVPAGGAWAGRACCRHDVRQDSAESATPVKAKKWQGHGAP